MHIACLTPLSPLRSGIANYSAMLLEALAGRSRVTAVVDQESWNAPPGIHVIRYQEFVERRGEFDAVVSQLGNNPHHEFIYLDAIAHPSVVVLHDLVLHHLIVETTLARGDENSYLNEIAANHGRWGEALARGRAAGFHLELGNFLFPASALIARKSRSVIVHNLYAKEILRSQGTLTPIHVVSHPHVFDERSAIADPKRVRSDLGFSDGDRVIGMFGFVTSAKRPEIVFESLSVALQRNGRVRLLVVGEPAPNVDLEELAGRFSIPRDRWRSTGFVKDEEFDAYLGAVDAVVNLRYPTAGETSGALIHVLAAGKPAAVNDYAQFAEYPAGIVAKIPFGQHEVLALAEFMAADRTEGEASRRSRVEWIRENARLDRAVDGYLDAIASVGTPLPATMPTLSALPVLPYLMLVGLETRPFGVLHRVRLALRNDGPDTIRSDDFGGPEYRVIAKVWDDRGLAADRWLRLDGDVARGETRDATLLFRPRARRHRLELIHGIQGIPVADDRPFAVTEFSV